jgi:hypothetical protein
MGVDHPHTRQLEFSREGVMVLKKETNRHGGFPSKPGYITVQGTPPKTSIINVWLTFSQIGA